MINSQKDKNVNEESKRTVYEFDHEVEKTRVVDREALEDNVRRLGAVIFRDKMKLFGEMK